MNNEAGFIELFLPLLLMSIPWAVAIGLLAKDKGRNVVLWVVLTLIPIFNFVAIIYIVGATNRRMEDKIDDILDKLNRIPQQ